MPVTSAPLLIYVGQNGMDGHVSKASNRSPGAGGGSTFPDSRYEGGVGGITSGYYADTGVQLSCAVRCVLIGPGPGGGSATALVTQNSGNLILLAGGGGAYHRLP